MTDPLRPNGSMPDAVPVSQWPGGQKANGADKPNGHDRNAPSPLKLYKDFALDARKEWVVRDFLGVGEFSIWFGEPGTGKSVLLGDLALHVAAGLDWQGHPVRRGLAVYVALERPALVERRALAFRIRTELADIPFVILRGPIDFTAKGTAGTLKKRILEAQALTGETLSLVVIDTVSIALCGADENSSQAMGAFVATVHALQAAFPQAHIIAAHHQPHDANRLRGHGALLGAVDTTVEVSGKKAELRTAAVRKNNDGPEGSTVHFRLESVTLNVDEDGNATTAPFVVGVETEGAKRNVPKPKLPPAATDRARRTQGDDPRSRRGAATRCEMFSHSVGREGGHCQAVAPRLLFARHCGRGKARSAESIRAGVSAAQRQSIDRCFGAFRMARQVLIWGVRHGCDKANTPRGCVRYVRTPELAPQNVRFVRFVAFWEKFKK